jgi:Icc-related predicted phosphoesterase
MNTWYFVSDLHGDPGRYRRLVSVVIAERPAALLLGGDLLPPLGQSDFIDRVLAPGFAEVRQALGPAAPRVLLIPGNDDRGSDASGLADGGGLWEFAHGRRIEVESVPVFGYAFVPPTPFPLKDWERYDVSRGVDPGCTSPEEGVRTVAVEESVVRWATIAGDLDELAGDEPVADAVLLFHAPPYDTPLDRAALDGRSVDHVPLDVHVGSIAIRRFIERRQPRVTLHGHVHEAARLTGTWRATIGRTHCLTAAHDGAELALIRFDPRRPETATRELLPAG